MVRNSDYIVRLIEEFGQFLVKVSRLIEQGDKSKAETEIDNALFQVTGINSRLFSMLQFDAAMSMIERDRRLSAYECAIIARLLFEKCSLLQLSPIKAHHFLALARSRKDEPGPDAEELLSDLEDQLPPA